MNAAGATKLLGVSGSSMAAQNATITSRNGALVIEDAPDSAVWTTSSSDTAGKYHLHSDGGYLEGYQGNVVINTGSLHYSARGWTYSDNQLKHTGGDNTYVVYYSNGFTSTYDSTSEKIYLFVETASEQPPAPAGAFSLSVCGPETAQVGSDNGNYSSENGVLFNKDKTFLLQYPAGKAGEYQIPDSVTDIRHRAFIGCTGLTSVMIPDSVTDISVDAFIGCTALKRVTVLSNDCTIADGKTTLGDPDVTTIYGLKGSTAEAYAEINGYKFEESSPFEDVMKGEYYYEPVQWAVGHDPQITNGTSATTFSPDKTCTRAQVVTFLWRAKGCPEPTLTLNPFEDVKPDQYYYKAVLWAVQNSITNGVDKTHFGPDKGCTRAQVVTFLWRTESQPEPTLTLNPFTDVLAAAYYYKAVLWAVQNGITTGTGADKFSPDSTCTRAQIVTFLYRDMK